MFEVLFLLTIKHFVVDALLQTLYQYLNKGDFLRQGGILHAGLHGFGTVICFNGFGVETLVMLGLIDMIIHYSVDLQKQILAQNSTGQNML